MAVIKKTLFAENLDRYNTFVTDTNPNSTYFNITELPDAFTGGKNAFLIAGSGELVADTLIKIEIKDALGNVIYHEPGEGTVITNANGEQFVTEYYEGISKVVAVYVYPDTTAYGPCTITILGELSSYIDDNGLLVPIPVNWQGTYNVKWQRSVNVNPTLPNTTKIRFYRRPTANITELISPIYRIDSNTGLKINSGINQSFANIKISNLETFAGDVKRIKVFRTSLGDISDYDMIQDILVESKELLTSFDLTNSVVGNTGIFTNETLQNYWKTGSLRADLDGSRVESGLKLTGSGFLTYSASLDLKSTNTYELNLDAFYSASTPSNLGIYLSYVSSSTTFSSSIGELAGINPTKNLLDTNIPFTIDRDYPTASLYFSQSQGEWHLGNISLKLSEDTAFSPDEVSFITTMPTVVGNEDFNFKFEFYDVNNNYVPVFVTGSANFQGGSNAISKLLTFETDRTAFRFSSGSIGNPPIQFVKFKTQRTNFTGSVSYFSASFDVDGNYIQPSLYSSQPAYPGLLTNASDSGALLSIASFTGSLNNIIVGSITYTASCEGFEEYETIYRFEDGENAPGLFVTSNTNQFIYKATDLSLNPSAQKITIEAKRKNLASATTPLTVNSGSGKPPLTFLTTNSANGVDTYELSGLNYPYSTNETIYSISGSDQFGNEFSDAIKITPIKILDGFSINVSNENTSFPALSTGVVSSGYIASSGSLSVKVGNETINYSNLFVTNSYSASISATTNVTANSFNGINYSISNLSADSGSLTLLVKYKDGSGDVISGSRDITYSKSKAGVPNVEVAVSPSAQTIEANSKGSGSAIPNSLTVTALEGGISRFASIGTPTYTNGLAGSVSSNTITFSSNASTILQDTATITIPINYTDSEGTTGTKNVVATISKARKAAPTTLALLSSETQTILSSSTGYATPSTFTIALTEGGSNYTYDDTVPYGNSTFRISSISGGSGTTTIQPTTPTINDGTTVSLTIAYVNSEGTTGTITKTHKVAVSLEGIRGVNGDAGAPGADGRRTATGMIFYQPSAASAPPTPSATSYTFSSNSFGGLTSQWAIGAPTYAAGNSNKYWYSTYTAVETTAGGGTAVPTFSAPAQAINFTGLVTFTSANNLTDGTNVINHVPSGSITNHIGGANVTTIEGGKVSTGVITSTGYSLTGNDTLASGSFTGGGTIFNLNNGSLRSKNFYISSTGDAVFKGTMQIGGTDLTAANTLNENTTKAQVGLANVSNLTPQNQAQTGLIAGTTITGGGITLSNGGNIKGGQTDFNSGTGFFLGYSGSAYVFSIGDGSTKGIAWNGTTLAIGGDVSIGSNLASALTTTAALNTGLGTKVSPADVTNNIGGAGVTTITGNKVRTGVIQSTNHAGSADGTDFSTGGMSIDLTNGGISAVNFRITSTGDAFFRGNISGASGTFGGSISIGSGNSIFKADTNGIYLGNATFASAPFRVSPSGALTATGVNISGAITATGGTFGGWIIDGNQLKSKDLPTQDRILLDGGANTVSMTVAGLTRFNLSTDSTLPNPNVTGGAQLTIGAHNQNYQGSGTLQFNSTNFVATAGVLTNFELNFSNLSYVAEYGGGANTSATVTYRIVNLSTGGVVASTIISTATVTGGDNSYSGGSISGGGPYQGFTYLPNGDVKFEITATAGHTYRAELIVQYDSPTEGTPPSGEASFVRLEWNTLIVYVAVQVASVVINAGGFLAAVNAGKYLRMSNLTPDAVNIEGGISWDVVGGRPGYVARAWVVATWDLRTGSFGAATIRAGQNVLAVGRNNVGWHNISFTRALPKGNVLGSGNDTLGATFASGLRRYSGTGASGNEYQVDVACNPHFGNGSSVMVYTYDNNRDVTENVNLLNVVVFSA